MRPRLTKATVITLPSPMRIFGGGCNDDPSRDAWQRPEEVLGALGLEPTMVVADVGQGLDTSPCDSLARCQEAKCSRPISSRTWCAFSVNALGASNFPTCARFEQREPFQASPNAASIGASSFIFGTTSVRERPTRIDSPFLLAQTHGRVSDASASHSVWCALVTAHDSKAVEAWF